MSGSSVFPTRLGWPAAVFLVAAAVYLAMLGPQRRTEPSPDNHYVHLARSWLAGELGVLGNEPPGRNDWACFDRQTGRPCPPGRWSSPPGDQAERYRWYVSFPPFPAAVILPAVAVLGIDWPDRVFWAVLAGFGPAAVFLMLRTLRATSTAAPAAGRPGDGAATTTTPPGLGADLGLTGLFAFGSVYFFTAVQGTVWFAAHVVAVPLVACYVAASLGARRPVLAGICLGLAFLTRPTTVLLVLLFAGEALRVARRPDAPAPPDGAGWPRRLWVWLGGVAPRRFLARAVPFALPILACGGVAMVHNLARFGDPFEFGHSFLQIRWRPRIETWGLFSYHYLGRNLGVFLASLPWLSAEAPHLKISLHGLALWFTTPHLLLVLFPKRVTVTWVAASLAAGAVCLLDLLYQNSGWVQFGYRFALDYLPLAFALIAMTGRRFGPVFWSLAVFAVAVNAFGAATFDRAWRFYDDDGSQTRIFQPD
jgi:hypothetical protein